MSTSSFTELLAPQRIARLKAGENLGVLHESGNTTMVIDANNTRLDVNTSDNIALSW